MIRTRKDEEKLFNWKIIRGMVALKIRIFWRWGKSLARLKYSFLSERVSARDLIIYLNISYKYINIRNLNITDGWSKMATTFNNSRDSMYRDAYCLNEFPNKLFPPRLSCFPLMIQEATSVTMERLLWSPDVTVSFAFVILLKIPAYDPTPPFPPWWNCYISLSLFFSRAHALCSSLEFEDKDHREIINTLPQLCI